MRCTIRTLLAAWPALAVAAVLAGCASASEAMYQEQLGRAEKSIERAEQAGAYQYGSMELNAARDKLSAARQAARDDEFERAIRLAEEASLDAELAAARTQNAKMQAAVAELRDSIETLREEIARQQAPM